MYPRPYGIFQNLFSLCDKKLLAHGLTHQLQDCRLSATAYSTCSQLNFRSGLKQTTLSNTHANLTRIQPFFTPQNLTLEIIEYESNVRYIYIHTYIHRHKHMYNIYIYTYTHTHTHTHMHGSFLSAVIAVTKLRVVQSPAAAQTVSSSERAVQV